jgi:hypothetical protein
MGESGRQEQPPALAADGGGEKKPPNNDDERKPYRGRRNNRGQTNKPKWKESVNTPIHIQKEKFVGRSEDPKGYIYDVTTSKGEVALTRTTEEIARHVGEKYTTIGSYIRTTILTLKVPAPTRPGAPAATGTPAAVHPVDQEIFKEEI